MIVGKMLIIVLVLEQNMLTDTQFTELLKELVLEGIRLDVREKIAVGYKDDLFVFTANKVGDFWYPRRQSSLL